MKKKTSKKKQKYITKYTSQAYITYQFRLRKAKDQEFIKEISKYGTGDDKQAIKKIVLEFLLKKHINFNQQDQIFETFIKSLFEEKEINGFVKLTSFRQIIELYNYDFLDDVALNLILEQFDAKICNTLYKGQENKYFYDDRLKKRDYKDCINLLDDELNNLLIGHEKRKDFYFNNVVPIEDKFEIKKGMTNIEFDKICKVLLEQGLEEEDIRGIVLKMFEDGKIDVEDMKKLAGSRGYYLTDEFLDRVKEKY